MPPLKNTFSKIASTIFPVLSKQKPSKLEPSESDRLPTLEIRIPISPNEQFMRMLHYLVESLQTFAGPIGKAAHCVASVSADEPRFDIEERYPWVKNYSLEFHWLDQEMFDRDDYDATGYHRFWIESDADIVALVDADILIVGDLDQVVKQCYHEQKVLGFIGHVSPFQTSADTRDTPSEEWWNRIFAEAKLPVPELEFEHTGWGFMTNSPGHRYCPAYFNYGFILIPRQHVENMGKSYIEDLGIVNRVVDTWYKSQIANIISFVRHGIPAASIPLKYNFPLHIPDDLIRTGNPDPEGQDSIEDIRIFHYLGEGEVHKGHFGTEESIQEVLARTKMTDAGTFFQSKLKVIHDRIHQSKNT